MDFLEALAIDKSSTLLGGIIPFSLYTLCLNPQASGGIFVSYGETSKAYLPDLYSSIAEDISKDLKFYEDEWSFKYREPTA